jgi:PAS domain S-box-containing protein
MNRYGYLVKSFIGAMCLFLIIAQWGKLRVWAADTQPNEVVVGVVKNFPPFYSLDDAGSPTGFAIDVMNEVAKGAGIKVKYRIFDNSKNLRSALNAGQISILPNIGITAARKKEFLLTRPISTLRITLFVRESTKGVKNLNDLANKRIGLVKKTLPVRLLAEKGHSNVTLYEDVPAALIGLLSEQVDAISYPEAVVWKFAESISLKDKIRVVDTPITVIDRAMAVRLDQVALHAELDNSLKNFLTTLKFQEIYLLYFSMPKEFWTTSRIMLAMGLLLVLTLLAMGYWRYKSIAGLNQELQVSEQRFKSFAESASDWFWEMGPDLRFSYHSERYFEITGFTPQEKIGTPRTHYVGSQNLEKDAEKWAAHEHELEMHKSFKNFEYSFRKKDNSIIHVSTSGVPLFNSDGRFLGYRGSGTDITARKIVEESLAESEARFRSVLDSSPAAITLKDCDGRLLLVNKTFEEWYGSSASKLIGKTSYDLVPIDQAENIETADRAVIETGKIIDVQGPRTLKAGGIRFLASRKSPVISPDGKIIAISTVVTDITELKKVQEELQNANDDLELRIIQRTAHLEQEIAERKKAELELSKSEERFRTLINTANYGILVHRNRVPLYANAALAKMYGYDSPSEILALKTTKLLTHPDYDENIYEKILSGHNFSADRETMGLRKNGTAFWEDRRLFVINWEGEAAVCSIRSDIDERKRAQDALLGAKVEAETLNRVKTDFLANMSHELRTPLNAIIGFSEVILGKTFGHVANEKQEEYIHDINRSGNHLLQLINDILDVTAIEEGKLELQDNHVVVVTLVEEAIKMMQPRANVGKVTLSSHIDESVFALRGDERRLRQILLNLINNAVKFTQDGGRVSLECHLKNTGQLAFIVTDNGIGMSEEGIKTALEPFGQVDDVFDGRYEGTGLGLPLTIQLVESHGGTLEVASKLGSGTTITMLFPKERVVH